MPRRAFSDGRAAIKISDRWGFIDTEKKTVVSPQFISAAGFRDGLAPVRASGNLWGYVIETGSMTIEAQFEEARPFRENRAAVGIDGKWAFIDASGTKIVGAFFDEAADFDGGLARVRVDVGEAQRYGYIDRAGGFVWYPTD